MYLCESQATLLSGLHSPPQYVSMAAPPRHQKRVSEQRMLRLTITEEQLLRFEMHIWTLARKWYQGLLLESVSQGALIFYIQPFSVPMACFGREKALTL